MSLHLHTLPSIAALGAVMLVGSTGGALGGALITSAEITDGTVTTSDVKDDTLGVEDLSPVARAELQGPKGRRGERGRTGPSGSSGADGVSGLEWSYNSIRVAAKTPANLQVNCPEGKVLLGGTAWWGTSPEAVQLVVGPAMTGGTAYTAGVPLDDTLNVRLFCATVR